MRFPNAPTAGDAVPATPARPLLPPLDAPVPVTILTGFLGAGKTTLLNHILTAQHGLRIAVIENEFGEVDVDSDLVMSSDEEIFQMTNGCICCVVDVRTDLVRILQTLLARPEPFDHILVETSGLADPTPVAATFFMDNEVARRVRLDGVVTLVDALHVESHLDDPALTDGDNQAVSQIVAADRLVINKIDLVDEAAVARVAARLGRLNEGAVVLRSQQARVDLTEILGIAGFDSAGVLADDPYFLEAARHVCSEDCEHAQVPAEIAGHRHDPSVGSVSLIYDAPFDRDRLDAALRAMLDERGDDVFRLKGIVALPDDPRRHVLQGVHRILDLRPGDGWRGAPRQSKFVFIGRRLDQRLLRALLDGCVAEVACEAA